MQIAQASLAPLAIQNGWRMGKGESLTLSSPNVNLLDGIAGCWYVVGLHVLVGH